MPKRLDLTGQNIFDWYVEGFAEVNAKGHSMWWCVCQLCGTRKQVLGISLQQRRSRNCGCARTEKLRKVRQLPEGMAAFHHLIRVYRRSARRRDLEYTLTKDQLRELTKGDCHYCGIAPKQVQTRICAVGDYIYNGLDRLDNGKGYTAENCVPACRRCNYMKAGMSYEDFLSVCRSILDYRKNAEEEPFKEELLTA